MLQDYVRDRLDGRDDVIYDRIFITHTPCPDGTVEAVREAVGRYAKFTDVIETTAGCTISCHCGPNTLGILFIRSR